MFRTARALGLEYNKLKTAMDTLTFITAELQAKRTSLQRLRRMLFGASTETTRNVLGEQGSEPGGAPGIDAQQSDGVPTQDEPQQKPKAPGHGRNGAAT
jgi:transposase